MSLVAAVAGELCGEPGEVVGIGPVQAAIGTCRVIARLEPHALVLTGSAGAYRDDLRVGDVVIASEVGWSDAGVQAGLSYAVGQEAPAHCDVRAWPDLRAARVLCVPSITSDREVTEGFAARWDVEHLEAWSVLRACRAAGVGCVVVLGIANAVGPGAHEAWVAHHTQAEQAAIRVAQAVCRHLAQQRES